MKKFLIWVLVFFGGVVLLDISACNSKTGQYAPDRYFSKAEQDSIMVDVVSYIYKRPQGVSSETRFDEQNRAKYIPVIKNFEFVSIFFEPSEEVYYYYLIRPAKGEGDKKRGVGGKFKINEAYRITYFREIFNTPVLTTEETRKRGVYLWKDLIEFKNIDRYYLNKDYVEFPDKACKYDTLTHEWSYSIVQK